MSIVLMSDPRVAAIPVAESGETLADVRGGGELLLDDRRSDPAYTFTHPRYGVLDRLLQAQLLLPEGLHLLIVEGFRPPALQQRSFEEYAAELRAAHGDWSMEELRAQASRYVSPPEIAPHSAGATVDLTLVDADGTELDVGTRVNVSPEESRGRCNALADGLSPDRVVVLALWRLLLGPDDRQVGRPLRTRLPARRQPLLSYPRTGSPAADEHHAHRTGLAPPLRGGRDFRPLSDTEKTILTGHLALPEDAQEARALKVACGTGELARFLAPSPRPAPAAIG